MSHSLSNRPSPSPEWLISNAKSIPVGFSISGVGGRGLVLSVQLVASDVEVGVGQGWPGVGGRGQGGGARYAGRPWLGRGHVGGTLRPFRQLGWAFQRQRLWRFHPARWKDNFLSLKVLSVLCR